MRKMIAVAAVLAVTTAHAAEELKFGDINYFLKAGEFNVAADLNQTYLKESIKGAAQVTRGLNLDTRFAYAISDKLNAFVGLTYAHDRDTRDKSGANNGRFYSDGLANPALGVNYRFQNQNEARYNVDFGAVARIGIEDAETGTLTGNSKSDVNFAQGRDSIELNARVGRKWNEANEWQLAVGGIHHMEGESTLVGVTDQKRDEESSLDLYVRAAYQYRPVNEFMVLLSAQATEVGEREVQVKGTNQKVKEDRHVDLNFGFSAKYLVTENFIAKFNYNIFRLPTYDIKDGTTSSVGNRHANVFGLGVDFLF